MVMYFTHFNLISGFVMSFLRYVFQVIVGVVFGAASIVVLSPLLAVFSNEEGDAPIPSTIAFAAVLLLIAFAPTIRRAFGRGFLCLGSAFFALPLSTMVLSGVVAAETVGMAADTDKAMAGLGAGIAGGLMTGVAGFIGFFLGSILLLVGLVLSLGGRREVIVITPAQ
jgi:hypothetical protein